jgi:hypothetical protein
MHDLEQVAAVGLLNAADRFDLDRGTELIVQSRRRVPDARLPRALPQPRPAPLWVHAVGADCG